MMCTGELDDDEDADSGPEASDDDEDAGEGIEEDDDEDDGEENSDESDDEEVDTVAVHRKPTVDSDEEDGGDDDDDDEDDEMGASSDDEEVENRHKAKTQRTKRDAIDDSDDDEDDDGAVRGNRKHSSKQASTSGADIGASVSGFFTNQPSSTKFTAQGFAELNLSRPLVKACTALGYSQPTPIQAACIPLALMGRDVVGSAITGSGKTAAFALPLLERLLFRQKRITATYVLVLAPVRELAVQVLLSLFLHIA